MSNCSMYIVIFPGKTNDELKKGFERYLDETGGIYVKNTMLTGNGTIVGNTLFNALKQQAGITEEY